MSLPEFEARVALDFLKRLRKLLAIFAGGMSEDAQRLQKTLEMAGDDVCVDVFRQLRPVIQDCAAAVSARDTKKLKQIAADAVKREMDKPPGALGKIAPKTPRRADSRAMLEEAFGLWEKASKKDRALSFEIADKMVSDVREWAELGGEV